MKTWHYEMFFAGVVLAISGAIQNNLLIGILSSSAVLLSFGHMCVSERLRERQVVQQEQDVECVILLNAYLWAKEILWICVFAATKNYSALAGCFLFLAYPFWRLWYRKYHPMVKDNKSL